MSDDWEDDANPFGMQSPPSAKTQNCGLRPGQPFGQTKGSTLGRSQPPVHKPTGYNGVSESSNILKNNSISQSSTPRTKIVAGCSLSTNHEKQISRLINSSTITLDAKAAVANSRESLLDGLTRTTSSQSEADRTFRVDRPNNILNHIKGLGSRNQPCDSLQVITQPTARMRVPQQQSQALHANEQPLNLVSKSDEGGERKTRYRTSNNVGKVNLSDKQPPRDSINGNKESSKYFGSPQNEYGQRSSVRVAMNKSVSETIPQNNSQFPTAKRYKPPMKEKGPIVIDLLDSDDDNVQKSEKKEESELDVATRNMEGPALLSFLFNFVDESDRCKVPSKRCPLFYFSPKIPVKRLLFGSLSYDNETLSDVEKLLKDLSIRLVGVNENALLFNIIDTNGKPVIERVKFQHIKSMHKFIPDIANEVVFALVPTNDISLVYLTAGYGSDHVIYPQSTKHELKNILIVVDRENSNILEQYLLQSKEAAFVTCDKKFQVHFKAYLNPDMLQDRESIIAQLISMKSDQASGCSASGGLSDRQLRRRTAVQNTIRAETRDPDDAKVYLIFPPELETMDAITIHNADIKRLAPGVYFNDSLIDVKIKHMVTSFKAQYLVSNDTDKSSATGNSDGTVSPIPPVVNDKIYSDNRANKIHAFSCLFYTKYTEASSAECSFQLVARWSKNVDLFTQEFILFPINLFNHWSLVVVVRPYLLENLEAKVKKGQTMDEIIEESGDQNLPCFLHLDSLNMHPTEKLWRHISAYLWFEREALKKRKTAVTEDDKVTSSSPTNDEAEAKDELVEKAEVKEHLPEVGEKSPINVDTASSSDDTENNHRCSNRSSTPSTKDEDNGKRKGSKSDEDGDNLQDTETENEGVADSKKASPRLREKRQSAKQQVDSPQDKEIEEETVPQKIKRLMTCFKRVKCKVPGQMNGYDCGVFVTRYAQMILDKWPTSTQEDIKERFQSHFATEFSQDHIDQERDVILCLLKDLREKYLDCRPEIKAKELAEEEEKRAKEEAAEAEAAERRATEANSKSTTIFLDDDEQDVEILPSSNTVINEVAESTSIGISSALADQFTSNSARYSPDLPRITKTAANSAVEDEETQLEGDVEKPINESDSDLSERETSNMFQKYKYRAVENDKETEAIQHTMETLVSRKKYSRCAERPLSPHRAETGMTSSSLEKEDEALDAMEEEMETEPGGTQTSDATAPQGEESDRMKKRKKLSNDEKDKESEKYRETDEGEEVSDSEKRSKKKHKKSKDKDREKPKDTEKINESGEKEIQSHKKKRKKRSHSPLHSSSSSDRSDGDYHEIFHTSNPAQPVDPVTPSSASLPPGRGRITRQALSSLGSSNNNFQTPTSKVTPGKSKDDDSDVEYLPEREPVSTLKSTGGGIYSASKADEKLPWRTADSMGQKALDEKEAEKKSPSRLPDESPGQKGSHSRHWSGSFH